MAMGQGITDGGSVCSVAVKAGALIVRGESGSGSATAGPDNA